MYDLMFVDAETMPVENHFTATKNICCELQEYLSSSNNPKALDWI